MSIKSVSIMRVRSNNGYGLVEIQLNVLNEEGFVEHRGNCAYSPMGGDSCTCDNSQNVMIQPEHALKLYEELSAFFRETLAARASGNNTNGWRDVAADALREDRIAEVVELLGRYSPTSFIGLHTELRTELTKTKELLAKERKTIRSLRDIGAIDD